MLNPFSNKLELVLARWNAAKELAGWNDID